MKDQVLWRLLVATVLIQLLFAIWPAIDIAVSRAFVQPDGTFWLANSAWAERLRVLFWLTSVVLAIFAMIMLCISLARGAMAQTQWRLWAFITALYVTGPGLLVNGLLKQVWGRARPAMVEAFGGDKLFTPPFEIADQCANNCSFVSGEAASAAVMVIVLAVCFAPRLSGMWRGLGYLGLGAMFVVASGLRVVSGRHFLSDVVFAGLFMLILARVFYRMFAVGKDSAVGLWPGVRADVGAVLRPIRQKVAAALQKVTVATPALPEPKINPSPDQTES